MDTLGEPIVNIGIFLFFVAVTLVIVSRLPQQQDRDRLLRRRARVHRTAERHRDLR